MGNTVLHEGWKNVAMFNDGEALSSAQICSQLTERLERQQATHREELDSLKVRRVNFLLSAFLWVFQLLDVIMTFYFHSSPLQSAVKVCAHCRHIVDSDEPPTTALDSAADSQRTIESSHVEDSPKKAAQRDDQEKESLKAQITELEQQLAQTKLQMVESKCKIQVRPNVFRQTWTQSTKYQVNDITWWTNHALASYDHFQNPEANMWLPGYLVSNPRHVIQTTCPTLTQSGGSGELFFLIQPIPVKHPL